MQFRRECSEFMARHLFRLCHDDVNFVMEAVSTLGSEKFEQYVAVPMHYEEHRLERFLSILTPQLRVTNSALVIFLNSPSADTSIASYMHSVNQADEIITRVRYEFEYSNLFLIHRKFSDHSVTMGRIRGLLLDVIIAHSFKLESGHPIISCLDIDMMAIGPRFLATVKKIFEVDYNLKYLGGVVNYGYHGSNMIDELSGIHVPELFIFNEINKALHECARLGEINYESRVWLEGANMTFSAAAYCACGGFEFDKKSGEDDALGRALHRYNPNVFACAKVSDEAIFASDPVLYSKFEDDAWVVTDPRRILRAIYGGRTGMEAWADVSFMQSPAAKLNSVQLALECERDERLITSQRLSEAIKARSEVALRWIEARLLWIVERSLDHDGKCRNIQQREAVMRKFGLRLCNNDSCNRISWRGSSLCRNALRMMQSQ